MRGCFEVVENSNCKNDIDFKMISKCVEDGIPEGQRKLYIDVESVNCVIQSLRDTDKKIKRVYFKKLLSLSQVGLTGENAQTELAMEALNSLKEEITIKEGGRIKNSYMFVLGIYAILLLIISGGLLGILNHNNIFFWDKYIYVFMGAMVGTWISFGARKVNIPFNELNIIEEDRLNPIMRLLFVGITSIIFMLFINSEIIGFSVGKIESKSINSSIELQIVLGILSGLIEYKLAIDLFNKANEIVKINAD